MTIELGILISIMSLVIAYLGYKLNKQKQVKEHVKETAKIETQLNYIGKGVDDIRIKLDTHDNKFSYMNERVTRVEESVKSAHKRIDKLEKGDV